jgi:hypothetical protein
MLKNEMSVKKTQQKILAKQKKNQKNKMKSCRKKND